MPKQTITTAAMRGNISAAALEKNQEVAGIPDSKPFGGRPDDDDPILNLHVGGVLVKEMLAAMTPEMAAIVRAGLTYGATDEGIDKRNEGKTGTGAQVLSGDFENALRQRKDDLRDREMEPFEARDPLKEVADEHVPPGQGFRPKFLSQRRVKERGTLGGYEVVKDPKTGDPVQVQGMILGRIPEAKARARNRKYQANSRDLVNQITKHYKQEGGTTAVADQ